MTAPVPPSASRALDTAALVEDVRGHAFRLGRPVRPDRIGAEVEFIPVDASSRQALPVAAEDGISTSTFLLPYAEREGWAPTTSPAGAPAFHVPGGATVSFEPGGQLEFATPALESVDATMELLDRLIEPLVVVARAEGVELVARGVDPWNPVGGAVLAVDNDRYHRMSDHYDRRGLWGRRMMRQSAAIHVNLDLGSDPLLRWRVANRAAPVWTAMFANSPRAEGRESGHRSWRAAQWRRLDPGRTGVFESGGDPAGEYVEFALDAEAFLLGDGVEAAEPFRHWVGRGVDRRTWRRHLTTLFPEIRPRGYLEIRPFDALPPRWYAAPLVTSVGLLYDAEALREADALLPPASVERLERAGRLGLADPDLRSLARDIGGLALEGAARLGSRVGRKSLDRTRDFLEEFTFRGSDPGHSGVETAGG